MSRRILTGAVVVLAAWLAFLWVRHVGVIQERERRALDSLSTVQAKLDSATALALSHHRADSLREAQQVRQLQRAAQAVVVARQREDSLATALARVVPDTAQALLSALRASWARSAASLEVQRDSALSLWRQAAMERDTLAALLRAQQAQTAALNMALVRARRKPFWDRSGPRILLVALAVKGAADFIGGR